MGPSTNRHWLERRIPIRKTGAPVTTMIPPQRGVDRPDGGTTHHAYPSEHDPMIHR